MKTVLIIWSLAISFVCGWIAATKEINSHPLRNQVVYHDGIVTHAGDTFIYPCRAPYWDLNWKIGSCVFHLNGGGP
jgi:hypothetical protein